MILRFVFIMCLLFEMFLRARHGAVLIVSDFFAFVHPPSRFKNEVFPLFIECGAQRRRGYFSCPISFYLVPKTFFEKIVAMPNRLWYNIVSEGEEWGDEAQLALCF